MFAPYAGADGCWFFPAVGSGVYLNLGRTWLLYRKSDVSALHAQWARDDPQARGTLASSSSPELARLKGMPRGEAFPVQAADLGFDTVSVVHNSMFSLSEIVVTSRACMALPADRPLHACVSQLIDVRTWRARFVAGSCNCSSDASGGPMHSCQGVAHMR